MPAETCINPAGGMTVPVNPFAYGNARRRLGPNELVAGETRGPDPDRKSLALICRQRHPQPWIGNP